MTRAIGSCLLGLAAIGLVAAAAWAQSRSVVDTAHNLSASGPGAIRALTEEEICIFCHTPHNAAPIHPLWNRSLPVSAYTVYGSSALDADPGQPTGASKLCLSCHDGTIALGSVLSRDEPIQMADGITTLRPGASNLGTDLSDDHPISFRFDAGLAAKDTRLSDPHTLPANIRLDRNDELQCTACHDPHDNQYGSFLVMNNQSSTLCLSCHLVGTTTLIGHENCVSCHRTHSAPSGPFLLAADRVSSTCLDCHDGSHLTASNVFADLQKLSVHDTDSPIDPADKGAVHATCADCHEPHTMRNGGSQGIGTPANFGAIDGVNVAGAALNLASAEYEVCFKCHADENALRESWVPRQLTQINTRLEFDPSAVSFHPVVTEGRNSNVPSLKPGWTESSQVRCSDCHGSDTSRRAGGSGPNGVHGSNEAPLLLARYETSDFTPESTSAYALCYSCHDRDGSDGILSDRSFLHDLHVRQTRTPCSACHDAHGVSSLQGTRRNNSHLINFDVSIVFPEPQSGRLEFQDMGTFSGNCTLTCHGKIHDAEVYSR